MGSQASRRLCARRGRPSRCFEKTSGGPGGLGGPFAIFDLVKRVGPRGQPLSNKGAEGPTMTYGRRGALLCGLLTLSLVSACKRQPRPGAATDYRAADGSFAARLPADWKVDEAPGETR